MLRSAIALLALALSLTAQEEDPDGYRLKANDQIALSVFGEPDLASQVQLTVAGETSLPLIGAVKLAGMTLREAEATVTELYNADYLVEPKLSINLLNAADERVIVMGAVNTPGPVVIPANTTLDLVSAVDSAGKLTAMADPSRVEIKRGEVIETYNLDLLRKEGTAPVMLAHGDKINVPTLPFANKRVTILGEVGKPGEYEFPPAGNLDVATLAGFAGGLSEQADSARITVKRGAKIYAATMRGNTSVLMPGDIVTIPRSRFVGKYVTMEGQVGKPGLLPFPLNGQLDLVSAIANSGGFARLANKKKVVVTRLVAGRRESWDFNVENMAAGKIPLFQLLPGDLVSVPVRRF